MILITGGAGQLAQEFARFFKDAEIEFLAPKKAELDIEFVTYSTDFVFDGKKLAPYNEEDEVNPISVYGKSKALGEKLALEANDKTYIFRVSWVFGKDGIYHLSGEGEVSRYEQGRYILNKLGYKGEVVQARCSDFTPYDIRPKYSKLSSSKVEKLLKIEIPSWKIRTDDYLDFYRKKDYN